MTTHDSISIVSWNATSLNFVKIADTVTFMNRNAVDVAAICETWWNESSASICDVVGFNVYSKNRHHRRGGGVALFVRDTIVSRQRLDIDIDSCECVFADVYLSNNRHLLIGSIYVPPQHDTHINSISAKLTTVKDNMILLGDFNAHSPVWD